MMRESCVSRRSSAPHVHNTRLAQPCRAVPRVSTPVPFATSAIHIACWQGRQQHHYASRSHQPIHKRPVLTFAEAEQSETAETEQADDEPSELELEADFDLLSSRIMLLSTALMQELRGCSIYLVGMMGSGKSTLGKMLANTLRYKFFDTDKMIEAAHDKRPVSRLFEEYGLEYFRTCEAEVMRQLAPYRSLVVATGGGAVLSRTNWSHMQGGVVAWLNGQPDLLARRVAKDGVESRPLLAGSEGDADNSEAAVRQRAEAKLTSILAERKKFYESADIVIDLSGVSERDVELGAPNPLVMYRLLKALDNRIRTATNQREAKRNFVIEYQREADRPPPTMRTVPLKESPDS